MIGTYERLGLVHSHTDVKTRPSPIAPRRLLPPPPSCPRHRPRPLFPPNIIGRRIHTTTVTLSSSTYRNERRPSATNAARTSYGNARPIRPAPTNTPPTLESRRAYAATTERASTKEGARANSSQEGWDLVKAKTALSQGTHPSFCICSFV